MSRRDHQDYPSKLREVVMVLHQGGKPSAVLLSCMHVLRLHPCRIRERRARHCPTCEASESCA